MPKITPWNRGTQYAPNYYAVYRYKGERYRVKTHARNMQEFEQYRRKVINSIKAGTWLPPKLDEAAKSGVFARFAEEVNKRRESAGVVTAKSHEAGIYKNHLVPEFGDCTFPELLDYKRIRKGFDSIRAKGLSGSTMRNINCVFNATMRLAHKEGLIAFLPPKLNVRDGDLPPVESTMPEGWELDAVFDLEEIHILLADSRIEPQWRVMYAVYFLIGARFSEVTRLRVRDYVRTKKPLGQLNVLAGKPQGKKKYRTPPIHPDLAEWINYWLDEGYELHHGRKPTKDDFMFPSLSAERRVRGHLTVSHSELMANKWKKHHLPQNGLRHRRLHDARRTFLSLIRSSEASAEIARAITHTVIADKVLDGYTTFHWRAICAAVMAVEWNLPKPPRTPCDGAEVIDLGKRRANG